MERFMDMIIAQTGRSVNTESRHNPRPERSRSGSRPDRSLWRQLRQSSHISHVIRFHLIDPNMPPSQQSLYGGGVSLGLELVYTFNDC